VRENEELLFKFDQTEPIFFPWNKLTKKLWNGKIAAAESGWIFNSKLTPHFANTMLAVV